MRRDIGRKRPSLLWCVCSRLKRVSSVEYRLLRNLLGQTWILYCWAFLGVFGSCLCVCLLCSQDSWLPKLWFSELIPGNNICKIWFSFLESFWLFPDVCSFFRVGLIVIPVLYVSVLEIGDVWLCHLPRSVCAWGLRLWLLFSFQDVIGFVPLFQF